MPDAPSDLFADSINRLGLIESSGVRPVVPFHLDGLAGDAFQHRLVPVVQILDAAALGGDAEAEPGGDVVAFIWPSQFWIVGVSMRPSTAQCRDVGVVCDVPSLVRKPRTIIFDRESKFDDGGVQSCAGQRVQAPFLAPARVDAPQHAPVFYENKPLLYGGGISVDQVERALKKSFFAVIAATIASRHGKWLPGRARLSDTAAVSWCWEFPQDACIGTRLGEQRVAERGTSDGITAFAASKNIGAESAPNTTQIMPQLAAIR
jgi:hypothetical protein